MSAELRASALGLASRGCHVFPIPPGTKRSYVAWGSEATADPQVVSEWWSRWPSASIGVACRPSGLVVVDLDGPAGMRSWAALVAEHDVVETCTVSTGRDDGGLHLWFRAGEALVSNSSGLLGAGIDVRGNVNRGGGGNGGMVLAPPSWHRSGRRYQWADRRPLAPLPEWVRALATAPAASAAPARWAPVGPAASPDRLLNAVVEVVLGAAEGERNNRLYWAACRVAEHAAAGRMDERTGRDVLLRAADRVGLPDGEATRTVDSGLRGAA